jgi:hypothetical protein
MTYYLFKIYNPFYAIFSTFRCNTFFALFGIGGEETKTKTLAAAAAGERKGLGWY